MKICFSSYHKYPGRLHGVASHAVHDNIVKGLSELGHEVWYQLKEKPNVALPDGVGYSTYKRKDVDVLHINDGMLEDVYDLSIPWVRALHCDVRIKGYDLSICKDNWIYVSKTLAELYGSNRYVVNGINPAEFIYSEAKGDYLFFIVGGLQRAEMKGLEMALKIANKTGNKLKIAGSSESKVELERFKAMCESQGVEFCGPVYGEEKAALFAGAKALLFPSKFNEACPLVISESLMSGTPVISSSNGACPELLNDKVGIICTTDNEYFEAVENVNLLKPEDCRTHAMDNFHYLQMAENYVSQYELEVEKCASKSAVY